MKIKKMLWSLPIWIKPNVEVVASGERKDNNVEIQNVKVKKKNT